MLDVWAHRHADNPRLRDQDVNPDFDDDLAEMEAAAAAEGGEDDWEIVADDRAGESL